jgi:hypothetical protein
MNIEGLRLTGVNSIKGITMKTKTAKGPAPHRLGIDGKPAKREWIVHEQEGRSGGVSYHFSGKAQAVRKFERILKTLEGGSVTAVELWDSRRVARVTVRVRYNKPKARYSDLVSDGGMDPRNQYDAKPRKPTRVSQPHRNSDQ